MSDEDVRRINAHDHWPSRLEWSLSLIHDADLILVGRNLSNEPGRMPADAHPTAARNQEMFARRYASNETYRSLARAFGVSAGRAQQIVQTVAGRLRRAGEQAVPPHLRAAYNALMSRERERGYAD